jgi:hypothetical protein
MVAFDFPLKIGSGDEVVGGSFSTLLERNVSSESMLGVGVIVFQTFLVLYCGKFVFVIWYVSFHSLGSVNKILASPSTSSVPLSFDTTWV